LNQFRTVLFVQCNQFGELVMSVVGPSPTWCDVRCSVVMRRKAAMTRTSCQDRL
jgi:hypothetical protein